jgi:hypothetical protein
MTPCSLARDTPSSDRVRLLEKVGRCGCSYALSVSLREGERVRSPNHNYVVRKYIQTWLLLNKIYRTTEHCITEKIYYVDKVWKNAQRYYAFYCYFIAEKNMWIYVNPVQS